MMTTDEEIGSSGPLVGVLRDRYPTLATVVAAGAVAMPLIQKARSKFKEQTTYTITINSTDALYELMNQWLLSIIPSRHQRALLAQSGAPSSSDSPQEIGERNSSPSPTTHLFYDGTRSHVVRHNGHRYQVSLERGGSTNDDSRRQSLRSDKLVFTTNSAAGRDELRRLLDDLLEKRHKADVPPEFWIALSWGGWKRLNDVKPRPLETVFLPDGQLDRVVNDMSSFLAEESAYLRRAQPWHRGYLFHGPPGTGKTSLARALASHFNLNIYYAPLGDMKIDGELMEMVGVLAPRSIFLLEDVDVFHAATKRDDDSQGSTLSGLLNALDGIATPHGLITILTTNDKDALDDALIRPGRVDVEEFLDHVGASVVEQMYQNFFGHASSGVLQPFSRIAPSTVQQIMQRHADSPLAAEKAINVAAMA